MPETSSSDSVFKCIIHPNTLLCSQEDFFTGPDPFTLIPPTHTPPQAWNSLLFPCCPSTWKPHVFSIIFTLLISLEKTMAPHSSTLTWKIPWMEEPGKLQPMGSLRVRLDRATSLSLFTFMHCRRNGNPLQCSCLENPRDGGAWWAAVYGVAQSQTRLKWLSSSTLISWAIGRLK